MRKSKKSVNGQGNKARNAIRNCTLYLTYNPLLHQQGFGRIDATDLSKPQKPRPCDLRRCVEWIGWISSTVDEWMRCMTCLVFNARHESRFRKK